MAITKKHINSLKAELEKIEVAKYKTEKLNEDNTRKRIIEPILMSLGYSW
jgi:predicted type IV restriction endonuclease